MVVAVTQGGVLVSSAVTLSVPLRGVCPKSLPPCDGEPPPGGETHVMLLVLARLFVPPLRLCPNWEVAPRPGGGADRHRPVFSLVALHCSLLSPDEKRKPAAYPPQIRCSLHFQFYVNFSPVHQSDGTGWSRCRRAPASQPGPASAPVMGWERSPPSYLGNA